MFQHFKTCLQIYKYNHTKQNLMLKTKQLIKVLKVQHKNKQLHNIQIKCQLFQN